MENSGLAKYLLDEMQKHWEEDRRPLEEKWKRNEDAYACINEGIWADGWKTDEGVDWRSKTFHPLTKMKVMAAYSMILDMVTQGNNLPVAMLLAPWDEIALEDLPEEKRTMVEQDLEDATDLIRQQFRECSAIIEYGRCVLSGAVLGESYADWFIKDVERSGYREVNLAPPGLEDPEGQFKRWEPYRQMYSSPGWYYVSPRNVFRDMESDDMQEISGYSIQEFYSPYDLRLKLDQEDSFWVDEGIKAALADAPRKGDSTIKPDTSSLPTGLRKIKHRKKNIRVLKFYCRVPRAMVEEYEKDSQSTQVLGDIDYDSGDEVEIMAYVAGDHIIRYSRIEKEDRTLTRQVFEEKLDDPGKGIGVADNLQDIQLVLNGAIRAFEDNKRLASDVMAVIKEEMVADWDKTVAPGKFIPVADDVDDVRKAWQQLIVQDVGESLVSVITIFERYGDEGSNVPRIMQGDVAEKRKPDTLGELQLLMAAAGKYLGTVVGNYDRMLLEPMARRNFEWNMEDPAINKGKGNFVARARGFAAFQDRVVRVQKLMQILQLVLSHPALTAESKLRWILQEIAKGVDVDPDQALKSREEKAQDQAEQTQMQQVQQAEAAELDKRRMEEARAAQEEDAENAHLRSMEQDDEKMKNQLVLKTVGGGS